MSTKAIVINSKQINLMKAVTGARYNSKTVLTRSSWEFVELWLRRQSGSRAKEALFFWTQAKNFYRASECLPIESRPLTSYYCCLNAAKALLAVNGPTSITFENIGHGISSDIRNWKSNNIENAETIFLGKGVLYELSKYLSEEAIKKKHTIYDLLYNIPCVHRSFSITYKAAELFIPIRDIIFIVNDVIKQGWVQFQIDDRYANGRSLLNVPSSFEKVPYNIDSRYLMRSKKRFKWDIHDDYNQRLEELSKYHGIIRKNLYYIYGDSRLWYVKKDIKTNKHLLDRNSITLIFAVMHWLSELVRYDPERFEKMMATKQNWLIHEFLDHALIQFVDEISCEITKVDIMVNGYRK